MPREAIADQLNTGRDRGVQLRIPGRGAATAWEAISRELLRKKIGRESVQGCAIDRNSMILIGGW